MPDYPVISGLITGGLGATIGSVITAIMQVTSKRSEAKANAADLVTNAAGRMIDRLDKDNAELRTAFLMLTDILDEIIDDMSADDPTKARLRKANLAAKKAL